MRRGGREGGWCRAGLKEGWCGWPRVHCDRPEGVRREADGARPRRPGQDFTFLLRPQTA